MKRTTLILDAGLYAELRRRAADEQRTLTEALEQALRAGLRSTGAGRRTRRPLPSYDLGPYAESPADRGSIARLQADPAGRDR